MAAKTLDRFGEALGWLALITALALISPGVVLRAAADPAAEGARCEAAPTGEQQVHQLLQRLAPQIARPEVRRPFDPADHVVVLNNSGYNYRSAPPPPPVPKAPAEQP